MQSFLYFYGINRALMIKYTPANQLSLESFTTPFENTLSPDNRWVKLSKVIPWDNLASVYMKQLSNNSGRESINVRMVIAALIIKHKLGIDDRGTVDMISENIYLQYFCGLSSFQTKKPFHPTVFVDIRKRMGATSFDKWNEMIIEKADELKPKKERKISKNTTNNNDKTSDTIDNERIASKEEVKKSINKGVLKIDATVANQKIVYPTDAGLLNTARKESERIIDILYVQSNYNKKPRTYRKIARTEYLNFSKNRRKSKKKIRKFIRKQLAYLKRNLSYIEELLNNIEKIKVDSSNTNPHNSSVFALSKHDQKIYWVLQHIYEQQKYMYENHTHSVKDRIVNIYQPYVRPIPRGKDKASTEFGAKISASEVDGMSRVENISWDNFNEAMDLDLQVEMFKKTFGHYPELLLADQIYLNKNNRKSLKMKGIRIVGKPLGRPKKEKLSAYQKRKLKKERNQRNLIEGKFGQGKNAYGLGNIKAKTRATSESWISSIFFIMNLITLLKVAEKSSFFYVIIKNTILKLYFSIINFIKIRILFFDLYIQENKIKKQKLAMF